MPTHIAPPAAGLGNVVSTPITIPTNGYYCSTPGNVSWDLSGVDPAWVINSAVAHYRLTVQGRPGFGSGAVSGQAPVDYTSSNGGSGGGTAHGTGAVVPCLWSADYVSVTDSAEVDLSWIDAGAGIASVTGPALLTVCGGPVSGYHGGHTPPDCDWQNDHDAFLVPYELVIVHDEDGGGGGDPPDGEDEPPPPPPPPPPSTYVGVDLATTNYGLHVIFRDTATADVVAQAGKWVGAALEWAAMVTVAADAGGYAIAPSLAVARNQDLYAAWHDAGQGLHVHRSRDFGQTWAEITVAPIRYGRYPRLLITKDWQLLFYYSPGLGGGRLYGSTDHYQTIRRLKNFTMTEQPASLRVDRNGVIHLLYEGSGGVRQQTSKDAVNWTDRGVLIAGRGWPAAGYANAFGALFAWDTAPTPDLLQLYRSESEFASVRDGPFDVTNVYPLQVPGVAVDRWRYVWLALQAGGGFSVDDVGRLAPDAGPGQFAIDEGGGMGMF